MSDKYKRKQSCRKEKGFICHIAVQWIFHLFLRLEIPSHSLTALMSTAFLQQCEINGSAELHVARKQKLNCCYLRGSEAKQRGKSFMQPHGDMKHPWRWFTGDCSWQSRRNSQDETKPQHHISKQTLCKVEETNDLVIWLDFDPWSVFTVICTVGSISEWNLGMKRCLIKHCYRRTNIICSISNYCN